MPHWSNTFKPLALNPDIFPQNLARLRVKFIIICNVILNIVTLDIVVAAMSSIVTILFIQGMEGFEKQIDRLMELTAYQVAKMKEHPEKFYLLLEEPELTNVCFWYVPERLRSRNFPQAYTSDWQRELGKVK